MAQPSGAEVDQARQRYEANLTGGVLLGTISVPAGFDGCAAGLIGQARLEAFRSGREAVGGKDNDMAAVCLLRLGISPALLSAQWASTAEVEQARQRYPAGVADWVLTGRIPAPAGFDGCAAGFFGQARLDAFRSGRETPGGGDKDKANVCLLRLGISPAPLSVQVKLVDSTYKVASGNTSGFFKTGQNADTLLSGFDFNNAGGPLMFNHPSGIASDGTRLFLSDTFNNRVLVWNTLPTGNVPPDLVLGQKDFITNNPGIGRDQMNWPVSVSSDGKRLVVADSYNYRVLIWNSIPTKNGQPADLVIGGLANYEGGIEPSKSRLIWPWGVWTNGEKLAVSSSRSVLIWNTFPTKDNQPADLLLKGGGKLGTPRQVTSDGRSLIVGDHNAVVEGQPPTGSFFWKTFPTADDQPFDFYLTYNTGWFRGAFTSDGKLVTMDSTLRIWNSLTQDANDAPDLTLTRLPCWGPGDYEGVAAAGNRLYVSCGNGNMVVGYNSIPTRADQAPDFAIGSPDLATNTLETNFIMQNGVVASNGKSLFVSSGFDGKLYVWKNLPDQSGAHPDIVYDVAGGTEDIALWKDNLALAGERTVYIWKQLPVAGGLPDLMFVGAVGSVRFGHLVGVAMDDKYFYLADSGTNKVYVWKGIPSQNSEPAFVLDVEEPGKLSSDGAYLTVPQPFKHKALIYQVDTLSAVAKPVSIGGAGIYNGVGAAGAAGGHFFLLDGNNRVHIWRNIQDALRSSYPSALPSTEATCGWERSSSPHAFSVSVRRPRFVSNLACAGIASFVLL
ncbi:MAG: hypothetical protein HYU29_00010 [Chloroflexi bacterium]|nr:hypothetical protein [Chloroflexota bacterium]